MSAIRPVPMPALLLIFGFAGLVGWGRYYGWAKGSAPSSRKARLLTLGILLALPTSCRSRCLQETPPRASAVLASEAVSGAALLRLWRFHPGSRSDRRRKGAAYGIGMRATRHPREESSQAYAFVDFVGTKLRAITSFITCK